MVSCGIAKDPSERACLFLRWQRQKLFWQEAPGSALPELQVDKEGNCMQTRPSQSGQRHLLVPVTRAARQPGRGLVVLLVQRLSSQSEVLRSPGQLRPAQRGQPAAERGRPGEQVNGEARLSRVGETESAQARTTCPEERKLRWGSPPHEHVGRN